MTICGIDIKGSEAIFAVATQGAHGLEHVAIATKKIALDDDENAAHVKAFAASIAAFVDTHAITRIAIKKGVKKASLPVARPRSRSRASSSCWTTATCNCSRRKP